MSSHICSLMSCLVVGMLGLGAAATTATAATGGTVGAIVGAILI